MQTLNGWSVKRSGDSMTVTGTTNDPSITVPVTKVRLVEVRDGKVIAVTDGAEYHLEV